ncbi:MAG: 50S ribosomal protein L32 [bacterium]|nr:50S ribosomal protein L32 [bacterium]
MPQPKKRMTSTRSGNRRGQINLLEMTLIVCKKCKSPIKPHEICKICGFYNGSKVLDLDKKEKTPTIADSEEKSK